jgi:hypothetical protein
MDCNLYNIKQKALYDGFGNIKALYKFLKRGMRLSEVYSIIGEPNYYDDGTILYSGHSNDRIDEAVTASIFDNDKLLAERMKDDA